MRFQTRVTFIVGGLFLAAIVGGVLLILGTRPPAAPTTPMPSTVTPTPAIPIPPSPPPAPSSTPGPFLYTVQEGDTLASIAAAHGVPLEELIAANGLSDPNLIHAGQELVIPGLSAPTPAGTIPPTSLPPTMPPLTPLPTPTSSGPPLVEIARVLGAGDLEAEVVYVRNRGGMVSLEGWTLSSATGSRFTFPRVILFSGGEIILHTGPGQSTPTDLYWGRGAAAWTSGGLITLRDQEDVVVDTYIVP